MIPVMLFVGAILLAGAAATSTPQPPAAILYRLELSGGGAVWSKDTPMQSGTLVTFHRYPDGALVSIRRSDLVHVVITKPESRAVRALAAGAAVDIGITGSGGGPASAAGKPGAGATQRTPAARASATRDPAPVETTD